MTNLIDVLGRIWLPARVGSRRLKKTTLISDQSGAPIADGHGATVTIRFRDRRKGTRVLDLTDEEAERLGGRHAKRRESDRSRSK